MSTSVNYQLKLYDTCMHIICSVEMSPELTLVLPVIGSVSYLYSFSINPYMPGDICTYDAFQNNLEIKLKFTNYLKESCWFGSEQHFSLNLSLKNVQVINPSNAEATFGRSTRMQRFLKTIRLNPVMLVFIG